jgi:hypothetical protein
MARRNPWGDEPQPEDTPTPPSWKPPQEDTVDGIPLAKKKKSHRPWDQRNRTKAGYWGVPVILREAVNALAAELRVPKDDVIRAFFEFSLEDYRAGRLSFSPQPKAQKMTLFPGGWRREQQSPRPRTYPKGRSGQKARPKKVRTCTLTVRFMPDELIEAIKEIAQAEAVPIGELATAFIEHGLNAYQEGILVLNPQPAAKVMRLFGG